MRYSESWGSRRGVFVHALLLALSLPLMVAQTEKVPVFAKADRDFFEAKVRPLLVEHCFSCHGAKKERGGLRLDSREAILEGGNHGPALVPGNPTDSLIPHLLNGVGVRVPKAKIMPPKGKLPAMEIAVFEEWIRRGAPYPAGKDVKSQSTVNLDEGRKFWSLQPVRP